MKVIEHLKLRKRRRFKSVSELESFFNDKDIVSGLEYSYAEKCLVLREQIQLRKKLDGIKKIGEKVLHNLSGPKFPEPLPGLWNLFKLICTREAAHGIPPPVAPELLERRASKPADDSLATILLKRQHKEAEALTHAFYSNHRVEEDGEFTAYKMSRTLVQNPESYEGLCVKKKFHNGQVYEGKITEYYDHKQWWLVKFTDGDVEDWSIPDMKKWVPSFVCGPIIDGATEHTAKAARERTRNRRRHGRSNPIHSIAQEMVPILAAAKSGDSFELPEHFSESIGTVWKLLKTSVEDDGSRWGV